MLLLYLFWSESFFFHFSILKFQQNLIQSLEAVRSTSPNSSMYCGQLYTQTEISWKCPFNNAQS